MPTKKNLDTKIIESFLQGSDPQQYIVAVEAGYSEPNVSLIINDPEKGKFIENHQYKPFLWFKEEITKELYGGKKTKIIEACSKHGIKITKLRTSNEEGYSPARLENGYKFLATCTKSYNELINFFKFGGVDVFSKEFSRLFVMFSPVEQFLIQTGKRLFKGFEDYDDLHRLQFDLETEGLFASKHAIFQIGVRDNRGEEVVLETIGNTPSERRDAERLNIEKFFKIIEFIKPDLITGYNSENFDWPFLFERAERLSIPITELAITLNRLHKIRRKASTIKFGGETESYYQTNMWGFNIIDISHAVRRAMAINSEIKGWGLKYITQYSEIAKPNRVYVPGDKINSTWSDKVNQYAFNDTDGDWYIITPEKPLKEGYQIKTGAFIVQRYLCDDLWETEQIDNIFNQASFLIGKILPTNFQRSSTMGTAGQWKLIMAAWSYENGLAIPETQPKKDFTGGLSRLLEVGYAKNVVKLDYAALYPKTQLTHDIFPELDISGVMEGMLTYVVDTRDHFKNLTGIEKKKYKNLEKLIIPDYKKMSPEEIAEIKERVASMNPSELENIKKQIAEHKSLANLYDKKQLPLKILANSWFGSYGAPYIFNWGDTDSAEETTCRGRQYLRLMVKHFTEKHGFKALVGDSVTHDTPVYIKTIDCDISIVSIDTLFNEITIDVDGQERDFSRKNYQILTRNGWKNIHYVYRHKTDKDIFILKTETREIKLTEDHSIFVNGKKELPSKLNIGDFIDVYDIKSNVISQEKIIFKENILNYHDFVYDVSTEDGSFIAGVNGVCCSNTDGFNFSFPDNIDEIKYVAKGSHWKTKDDKDKELIGLDAVLAEFNENYMEGRMGLDIDDICNSTINFARKNYANDIGGKVKLVGNSVKSKKMSVYIEEFLGKGIRFLLDGNGHDFVNFYYEYVDKIYNYQIPLVKIATKAKVKSSISDYKKKATMKNKAGNPLPKQAHMELAIKNNLDVNLGDTLYYVNTGTAKSHGDLKSEKNKETGLVTVNLNCNLITPEIVEKDFETLKELEVIKKALLKIEDKSDKNYLEFENKITELSNSLYTDEYNVARYLDAFNKKVKPLLVCFSPEIRDKILLSVIKVKNKETKKSEEKLKERVIFTKSECELVSGMPYKEKDQDSYEELMRMEDKEIKFWDRVNKIPNNMESDVWDGIRADYHERMRIARLEGIQHEKDRLDIIFKKLELSELDAVSLRGELPLEVFILTDVDTSGSGMLISRKWEEPLCHISDIFKYEMEAIERNKFYKLVNLTNQDDRYQQWLDYLLEKEIMTGETLTKNFVEAHRNEENLTILIKEMGSKIILPEPTKEETNIIKSDDLDTEDNEDEIEEKYNEDIQLDDEFDDTRGEIPDGYVVSETKEVEKEDDGWLF